MTAALPSLRLGTGIRTLVRRQVRRLRTGAAPLTPVRIIDEADGCVIEFGPHRLTLRARGLPGTRRTDHDFAVFLLAALSLSRGWRFVYEGPVTASAKAQLRRYALIWGSIDPDRFHPLRLALPNTVASVEPAAAGRIVALSGGVDSTFAAMRHRAGLTHGMYAAGDGYPAGGSARFDEARRRVEGIAATLGLDLVVVESNAREFFGGWLLLHSAMLASFLHFAGRGLGGGALAADFVPYQELMVMPMGNLRGIVDCFSTDAFPLAHLGGDVTRTEKVRLIAATMPELFDLVSVCNNPAGGGGNCGVCEKCRRTRLSLQAIDAAELRARCEARMFAGAFDGIDYVRSFTPPATRHGRMMAFDRFDLIGRALPAGPLRAEIDALLDRLTASNG